MNELGFGSIHLFTTGSFKNYLMADLIYGGIREKPDRFSHPKLNVCHSSLDITRRRNVKILFPREVGGVFFLGGHNQPWKFGDFSRHWRLNIANGD